MTTKKFLRALNGEVVSSPPIWLMRQAGRYLPEYRKVRAGAGSFLDLCYAPDLAVEVSLQPIRRFGLDAAILFSDILVVPHGLGQDVRFVENEGPKLAAIRSVDALRSLNLDAMEERLAPVYQTVTGLAAALPSETALIGFAGAPWTVASYMVEGGGSRDFAAIKGWAYGDPEGFGKLIDLLVEATVVHLGAQVRAGAEAVQIFDSWAGVLPEAAFRRWIIEPTRDLVKKFNALCPGVPIIGFPRGAGLMYPDYIRETGVSAASLDTTVPTKWAATTLQSMVPVQGNLDPLALLAGGACMEQSVQRILDDLAGGPFIFNLGHGVVKETPPERVAELVSLVRKVTA